MPFFGMKCPQCQSHHLQKKRRTGVRYQEIVSDTGLRTGEYRFYKIHCYDCKTEFYCQEGHYYDSEVKEKQIQKFLVTEEEFLKAKMHKPGLERIGSTVSQYTLMIAASADCSYALKQRG
jgi:hypothetical protein